MKYSLTNSKFQRAFGRYFCRKNYFSTNHTWEFEECQIILKKSKKEAPKVQESAVKNDGKSDRTLSAKPRSNAPRQDRHPKGNSAMGNAFADALKNWKK